MILNHSKTIRSVISLLCSRYHNGNTQYPLCFIVSYVQPVTQHFESTTVQKAPLQSTHIERNGAALPSYINHCLQSEASITLRCWLCQPITQQYESRTVRKAPLQSKQLLLKLQTISIMKGSHHMLPPN